MNGAAARRRQFFLREAAGQQPDRADIRAPRRFRVIRRIADHHGVSGRDLCTIED
jgi:hypothetical protein